MCSDLRAFFSIMLLVSFFLVCFLRKFSDRICKNREISEYTGNGKLFVNMRHRCSVSRDEHSSPSPCSHRAYSVVRNTGIKQMSNHSYTMTKSVKKGRH